MLNREAVTSECLRIGDFQVLALARLIISRAGSLLLRYQLNSV